MSINELNHGDIFSYPHCGTYTLCELPVSNLWILVSNVNGNYWCRPGVDPEDAFGGEFEKFKRERVSGLRPKHFLLFSFHEGTIQRIEQVYKGSYDSLVEALHYEDGGMIQILCRDTLAIIYDAGIISREDFIQSIGRTKRVAELLEITCTFGEG